MCLCFICCVFVFCLYVLSAFYVFVFQIRDWVEADLAYFEVVRFHKPERVWFSLTWKSCLVNVLDTSLDLGSNTSILWNRLSWCSCAWLTGVSGLLRSACIKTSGMPPLRYWLLLHLSLVIVRGLLCSKELLCLLLVDRVVGTWILIPCWRSIHSPILNPSNPMDAHSSSFFVTWFRARTRVRWVALVGGDCFVTIN